MQPLSPPVFIELNRVGGAPHRRQNGPLSGQSGQHLLALSLPGLDSDRTSEPHVTALHRQSNVINLYDGRGSIDIHGGSRGSGFGERLGRRGPVSSDILALITTLSLRLRL